MTKERLTLALFALLVLISGTSLAAGAEAFAFNSGNVVSADLPISTRPFMALRFRLSEDVFVTDLGLYDYVGPIANDDANWDPAGLRSAWNITLWKCGPYSGGPDPGGTFATMKLLASATVNSDNGRTDTGFCYAPISPVRLPATESGQIVWYIIGASGADGIPEDAFRFARGSTTGPIVEFQSPLLYGRSGYGSEPSDGGSWWEILTGLLGDDPGENYGVNFKYTTTAPPPPILEVGIDVKPGSYPNSLNINGNGVIPVAILGAADFDVTTVDPSTLGFAGLEVNVKGKDKLQVAVEDVASPENGPPDGYPDLVVHFQDNPELWTPGEDSNAQLEGELTDGTPIQGADSIRVVSE